MRVRANSNSTVGFGVASGDDAWTESPLTYTNAPSFGAVQGSSGAVATGVWAEVTLPPSLFGGGDGPVTLVLTGTSPTGISFASSETATAPQLVLSLSGSVMPDAEPPSIPGGLVASGLTTSSVTIDWNASTHNFGVTGYRITRDGATVTTVGAATTTFTDTALVPDTGYGYQIFAFDAAATEGGALALRTNGFGTTNGATYASIEAGTTTAPQLIIVTS